MARANRHYLPGYVWHITHRCHKREFLLKFSKDKKRWLFWLFEAKKRYGLSILNYTVTSNHIHLLVFDNKKDTIPKSIQLLTGRTAREFNQRKKRKGAFREDRYHATAVQTDDHLTRCLEYIDLNMVRTGISNFFDEIGRIPSSYAAGVPGWSLYPRRLPYGRPGYLGRSQSSYLAKADLAKKFFKMSENVVW